MPGQGAAGQRSCWEAAQVRSGDARLARVTEQALHLHPVRDCGRRPLEAGPGELLDQDEETRGVTKAG